MKKTFYYIKDNEEICWCRRCETYHNCMQHGRDTRTPHGYRYFCEQSQLFAREGIGPDADKIRELTRKYADELLKEMGYDPSSTIPVYEQFLIKHDL